jgi:hypothetical protein
MRYHFILLNATDEANLPNAIIRAFLFIPAACNVWECLRERTKEMDEMKGVFGVETLHELALVITICK